MAIITALARAKSLLILPTSTESVVKVENAEAPATREFTRKFREFYKARQIDDSFDSISIVKLDDYTVKVELDKSIVRKLYEDYELKTETAGLEDYFYVKNIDKDNGTIEIKVDWADDYVGQTVTFDNEELQIFNDALAWYICGYTRFTLQEIKVNEVLITSSQNGDGSMNAYSVSSIEAFQKSLIAKGDKILKTKYFAS